MSALSSRKATAAEGVNRALALALRSPAAALARLQRAAAPATPTRYGQRARPVPLTRMGKPNV